MSIFNIFPIGEAAGPLLSTPLFVLLLLHAMNDG